MESLRAVLSAIQNPSAEVQSLLSCLDREQLELDVHICSIGGTGSTELSNFLNRHGFSTNLISDEDNLRHVNRPVAYAPGGGGQARATPRHCVYLFGDPLPAIASHYRRGQAAHQAAKTSGNARLQAHHASGEGFPSTFVDYCARGEDLFGAAQHLHNWLSTPTTYSILFVRYEQMFDEPVAASLLSYLCRHKKSVAELQGMVAQWVGSRRPRRSEPVPIDVYLRPGGMYQDLLHQINVMPPLFVRGPQPGSITELNLGLAGDDPSSLSVSEMMAGMSMSAAAPPTMPGSGASGSSGGGGV